MSDERSYPAGVACWVDRTTGLEAARHFYATQFGVDVRLMAAATAAGAQLTNASGSWNFSELYSGRGRLLVIEWAAAAIRPAAAGARVIAAEGVVEAAEVARCRQRTRCSTSASFAQPRLRDVLVGRHGRS